MCPSSIEQPLFLLPHTTLGLDVTSFLVDRKARNLSRKTIACYCEELGRFRAFLEGQRVHTLADVTPSTIRMFLLHLAQTGHNPGGCHVAYRTLKTFLRWAWAEVEIPGPCPIARVSPPKLPQEPLDPVSLEVVRAMLATCKGHTFASDRDRALVLCLLDTGCRASEFLTLDIQDVNLSSGAVVVRHGKGGKHRVTFLGAKARRELLRYLKHLPSQQGALWVTDAGSRLTYSGLRQVVKRRAERADVPVPSLHSFRRAFALTCLRGGMDVYSLQKLMGHAGLEVLRRYLAQTEADLQAAHEKSGPVDRLL